MQKCFKGLLKPRCFEIGKSRLLEMEKALYSRPKGLTGGPEASFVLGVL